MLEDIALNASVVPLPSAAPESFPVDLLSQLEDIVGEQEDTIDLQVAEIGALHDTILELQHERCERMRRRAETLQRLYKMQPFQACRPAPIAPVRDLSGEQDRLKVLRALMAEHKENEHKENIDLRRQEIENLRRDISELERQISVL